MAPTNAERQCRWREKQKQKDDAKCLEKEAKKKRDSYVPTTMLKPAQLNIVKGLRRLHMKYSFIPSNLSSGVDRVCGLHWPTPSQWG
ncbi:hypothetical protein ACJMK2_016484 [Sinanodonta woodiana]|uniref:Uncharacterized protein n=1 Tax=Sinanodonta woodiana TaxID=1069815 RepID=A0ABD3UXA6_SINWO